MIFDRHTKSVFCSKPSPNGDLFASGGEDDRGFIFDRQGELYMALFGHKGKKIYMAHVTCRFHNNESFRFGCEC